MKIGLYTIFRCTNYGAVLQAYALSRVLRRKFGEMAVDVINHLMDPRDNHLLGKITNPDTPWFQRWRNKRKFASRYYRPDLFERRRQKTVCLIEKSIRPVTRLYRSPSELRDLPRYDTVVVGSDQIWNPVLNHDFGCNQYLATYLPESQDRIAYAASFGVSELPDEFRVSYREAIGKFRAVSVREASGARICSSLIGEEPPVVLDPTMLLTADDWLPVVGNSARASGAFYAAYWVRTVQQSDVDALSRIAAAHGFPVHLMSAGPLPKLRFPQNVVPYVDADPFDFVRTIATSEGVVTDSFHGLQFATIFGKPLIALADLQDPCSNASRLVDFCRMQGVDNAVADIGAFRKTSKDIPVFVSMSGDMFDLREASMAYLDNAVRRSGTCVTEVAEQSVTASEKTALTVITATKDVVSKGQVDSLLACIRSVANIPCTHEHLVYDGASQDGTKELLLSLAHEIPTLKVVSERDAGIYDALNKGVRLARGEYIYVLGADDRVMAPQVLKAAVETGMSKHADLVISPTFIDGKLSRNPLRHRFLEAQMSYSHQGVLVRTEQMRLIGGFDVSFRICADLDALQKLHLRGASHVETHTAYVDRSSGGASGNHELRREEDIRAFSKNFNVPHGIAVKAYDDKILPIRVVLPLLFHKSGFIRDAARRMLLNFVYRKVKTPTSSTRFIFCCPVRRKRKSCMNRDANLV